MEKNVGSDDAGARPDVREALVRGYAALRSADIRSAQERFDEALKLDFDDAEVMFDLKCAGFWLDRVEKAEGLADPFERGEYITGQWKSFTSYQARMEGRTDDAAYAFRYFAFTLALDCFMAVRHEPQDRREADLSLRIGRCYKGRGEYEPAIAHLEEAMKARREDPEIVAELADAYAMVDQTRTAKALFREAFFLDPQRVDLDSMESYLMRGLIERVSAMGYQGAELREWLPVQAVLLGAFSVKRELRPVEAGKLRQAIYRLENELKEPAADRAILVPRLLNCYFWLVDHMVASREDRSKIDEVLLKIRILDPQVYKQYAS
jgi:tetratricopeptide (TPR) repeat protein